MCENGKRGDAIGGFNVRRGPGLMSSVELRWIFKTRKRDNELRITKASARHTRVDDGRDSGSEK